MSATIAPKEVAQTMAKHTIADGFSIIFDLQKSHGSWIVDGATGAEYLDFYGFFASLPLGFNHPVFEDAAVRERLAEAAIHRPANSDAASVELASFVDAFGRDAMPAPFQYLFFIDGGALAVENAMKAAFDWKVRKNLAAGKPEKGSMIAHFKEAFHGRTGYTMSVTNTDPMKVAYFPKFDWPRISNPKLRFPIDEAELTRVAAEEDKAIAELEQAFADHPDEIAGILLEPIQGEGGDNHFRTEFLQRLRDVADKHEALLIFDEVQTGFGGTGRMWAFEHFGVVPDIISFGKKTQVCGIMAGPRMDEVKDHVFSMSSRINSTWGGGLVDMVRCEIVLDVIKREKLVENADRVGQHLLKSLETLCSEFSILTNPRGRGLMCAVDCPDGETRDKIIAKAAEHGVLLLSCGPLSLRVRPALTMSADEVDQGIERLRAAIQAI